MQKHGDRDKILQIEWLYIKQFRFEEQRPVILEQEVINNPSFFAELISWIYKPEEGDEIIELDEKIIVQRSEASRELLNINTILPGEQVDENQ